VREQDVFMLADRTLERVIAQVRADQWDMPMPSGFAMRRVDHTVTLREIVNYHAYDDAWVPDMLAGRTMDAVGSDAWQGDLLGELPASAFSAIVEKACAAAEALDDLDRTVHCSFGDFSAREYFWQISGFRGLRAHDLAVVIGVDHHLPDDLVAGLLAQIEPNVEEWRALGVFGPAVEVPPGASDQDRLLGMTGRQPDGD
jgi:uncharacterized protein (TIGR03086 family)